MRKQRFIFGCLGWLACMVLPLAGHGQRFERYHCLSDFYDTDRWLLEAKRNFDPQGLLTQNSQYHSLSIGFFGIMRYEDYLKTQNPKYKEQVIAQFAYFLDTSKVTLTADGLGMGLPYRYLFKDMQAPWYSGMAQGVALSYLVRYYDLTRDERALKVMKQVAHFMLKPQEEGGTIGKTFEGRLWIEEYPNSTLSPQVMNGFINGLIGLKEYLIQFPEDSLAQRIHDSCYVALSMTIAKYDRHEWSDYMRVPRSELSNSYMQYQLAQMLHLIALYHDDQWLREMMIWAHMAYVKPDQATTSYRNPGYKFGVPIGPAGATMPTEVDSPFARVMTPMPSEWFKSPAGKHFPEKPILLNPNKPVEITPGPDVHEILLTLSRPDLTDKLTFEAQDAAGQKIALEVEFVRFAARLRSVVPMAQLKVNCLVKVPLGSALTAARVPNLEGLVVPKIGFCRIPGTILLTAGQTYKIDYQAMHVVGAKLFYRCPPPRMPIELSNWDKDKYIDMPAKEFKPELTGLHEFLLAFPIRQSSPMVKLLAVKKGE